MLEDYAAYVRRIQGAYRKAQEAPLPEAAAELPPVREGAPCMVLFSPHPDDEVITGGLPLRLRREAGWRILNVAVTLGSDRGRQAERLEEGKAACAHLGFDFHLADGSGLANVNLENRRREPQHWTYAVGVIGRLLLELSPRVVMFPHSFDAHPTHMGTHALVRQAMVRLGEKLDFYCVETEFWSPAEGPNLLIESSSADVADLVAALAFHRGEVARNPYHLRLPAWMMDNVRRGAELLNGHTEVAPDVLFATLYRLKAWRRGRYAAAMKDTRILKAGEDPASLFA